MEWSSVISALSGLSALWSLVGFIAPLLVLWVVVWGEDDLEDDSDAGAIYRTFVGCMALIALFNLLDFLVPLLWGDEKEIMDVYLYYSIHVWDIFTSTVGVLAVSILSYHILGWFMFLIRIFVS